MDPDRSSDREPLVHRVIVGTAGHIDHGKTALVRELTGTDPDRLKEEKERGITIDLGFASVSSGDIQLGFVDVPGHERFIKNMLAGVHGIDLVLFVVAADESVMPQTREHLDICKLLRVPSGLVVLTKRDLVNDELLDLVECEVRDLVAGTFLQGAPVVAVSAKTGAGMDSLRHELFSAARGIRERDCGAAARMPVDRIFTIRGFGTVVTGTLTSGMISIGDPLEVLPSGLRTSARGLQVHGRSVQRARAGERTAVNLQNVAVHEITRGDLLAAAERFEPTSMLDVRLHLLESAPQPLESRARVRLHHGSAELLARIVLLDRPLLGPGEDGLAQFRLERPAAFAAGDRFIIRRYSPQVTIGGGEVIDPLPEKHRAYSPGRAEAEELAVALRELEAATTEGRLLWWVEACGARGYSARSLGARTGMEGRRLGEILSALCAGGKAIEIGGWAPHYYSIKVIDELRGRLVETVAKYHEEAPQMTGMSREELRRRLLPRTGDEQSLELFNHLCFHPDVVTLRDTVSLARHATSLHQKDAVMEARILDLLRREGLQPPLPGDLLAGAGIEAEPGARLLGSLSKAGRIVRIADHYFSREAVDELIERLRLGKATEPTINVGRFKSLTGLSRKFAIPLLEYLDRIRVTERVGDDRTIL
ncbi:MAG: selenocysteine-specific translation elongation factor [Acidobacteria bacterium]|nr:selenocysteine-specific translation elongation factor [Acidobacteriota bacterium]